MARSAGPVAGHGRRRRRRRHAVAQPVERLCAIRQRAAADRREPARRRRHHRGGRRGAREAGWLHAVPRRGWPQRRVARARRQTALRSEHRLHADHPRGQLAGGRADPADAALHDAGRIRRRGETAARQIQLRVGGSRQLDASVHGLSQQPGRDRSGQRRLSFGRGNADGVAEERSRHRDHHRLDGARPDQGRQGSRAGRRLRCGRCRNCRTRRRSGKRFRASTLRFGTASPGRPAWTPRWSRASTASSIRFCRRRRCARRSRSSRPPTSSAARRSSSTPSSRASCSVGRRS